LAKQTINIGTVANDGTGDPLRDAMDKINDNFDEVYSSYTLTGAVTVGNSTVNSVVSNTGGLVVANSTITTTVDRSVIKIANSTVDTTVSVGGIDVGNSTVNTTINSSSVGATGATITALTATSISVGNSTVNTTTNSTIITTTSANVSTNTGLTLGSFTSAANGYTFLPNGIKMNWGWVSANSTVGDATLTSAFGTAIYNVSAISNTAVATYQAGVVGQNTSVVQVRTANATSTNVYWSAIGK
jgi:hypothetical protein